MKEDSAKVSGFDYHLSEELIAQNPVVPRDHSRLMVYESGTDSVFHRKFYEIAKFLRAGDVLVLNRSRVVPARIVFDGKEIFLLKKIAGRRYQAMVRPGKKFKLGAEFVLGDGLSAAIIEEKTDGSRIVEFFFEGDLDEKLEDIGQTPLPPYITRSTADFTQYQTVYAREKGSVAAPTAGLHFTVELLEKLKKSGVEIVELVLHVGRGTFLPVSGEEIKSHVMHPEEYELSQSAATSLNTAIAGSRRIVAVGTTSVRVLESCYKDDSGFAAGRGETSIFIYPGYKWKVVDALITNFHLPKSTLIMLVAAFLEHKGVSDGREKILELYDLAQREKYRFYSFGDAMMIF